MGVDRQQHCSCWLFACVGLIITSAREVEKQQWPERLATRTSETPPCGREELAEGGEIEAFECLFAQWYPSANPVGYHDATANPQIELAPNGILRLLEMLSTFGEGLGAADAFTEIGSGFGKFTLMIFLATHVGRAVGFEPKTWQHHVACAAGRAALGAGPTFYAVGTDQQVYAQTLGKTNPSTSWIPVGPGKVKSIAVERNTIFGVGRNKVVYKQALSTMTPSSDWQVASTAGPSSILVHDKTIYGIGEDHRILSQPLISMNLSSTWTPVSRGNVLSIAISDDDVFAVGTDLSIWQQRLSNMTTETHWKHRGKGSVERIVSHGGKLYAVAYDKRVWSQDLQHMTPETDWELVSGGDVLDLAVSPYGFHPMSKQMSEQGDLTSLEFINPASIQEMEGWEGSTFVHIGSTYQDKDSMMSLGWILSSSLQPGAIIFTQRRFPGCWPQLLSVASVELPLLWSQDSVSIMVYVVGLVPIMPQPTWLVSVRSTYSAICEVATHSENSGGVVEQSHAREMWVSAVRQHHPHGTDIARWRLAVAIGRDLRTNVTTMKSPLSTTNDIVKAACSVLLPGRWRQDPIDCGKEALEARARLALETNSSVLDEIMPRLVDMQLLDSRGRSLTCAIASGYNEDVAAPVLSALLKKFDLTLDKMDGSGFWPMDCAARRGHGKVVQLLLEHRAMADHENTSHRQPLHYAALHGHQEVVRLLVDHRASMQVSDSEGRLPWHLVRIQDEHLMHMLVSPAEGPWYG